MTLEDKLQRFKDMPPVKKVTMGIGVGVGAGLLVMGTYTMVDALLCYRASNCECVGQRVEKGHISESVAAQYCPEYR